MSRSPVPLLLVSIGFYWEGRDEVPWLATVQAGTGAEPSLPLSQGQTCMGSGPEVSEADKGVGWEAGVIKEDLGEPPKALMHRRCCSLEGTGIVNQNMP